MSHYSSYGGGRSDDRWGGSSSSYGRSGGYGGGGYGGGGHGGGFNSSRGRDDLDTMALPKPDFSNL